MTYANDVIEIKDRAKRRTLKRIERHTDKELDAAIEIAFRRFGEDFYIMLHGIDAYMMRREHRRNKRRIVSIVTDPNDLFIEEQF